MMSFKKNFSAETAIENVLNLILDDYINEQILDPIDKAVYSFEYKNEPTVSFSCFTEIICCFVKHIYANGFLIKQDLSEKKATEIALNILQKYYSSPDEYGVDTAYVISQKTDSTGINFVLNAIAEHIKTTAKQKHLNWVIATYIENLDWNDKCLIAETLLEFWETFLPPVLLGFSSERLASQLPEILSTINSVNKTASNLTGRDLPSR